MLLKFQSFFVLLAAFAHFSVAQPKVFLLKEDRLPTIKKRIEAGDATAKEWLEKVLKDANKQLTASTVSVMEKKQTPPSGSKHDYMSMAPYFWPDPTKPNGIPYIRKDGEHNPETYTITDHELKATLDKAVKYLAVAYYFTKEEKYAQKAAEFVKAWFLDSATKMNPNLQYAQYVKGVNDGRGIGILESMAFTSVVNSVGLLQGSAAWTSTDDAQLKAWFTTYLDWMLNSKNGKDEHNSKNNHGIYYDVQVLTYAIYLDKKDFAKEYFKSTLQRIPVQIEPDGRQPLELERTNGLGYSTFCLEAWFNAATLAEKLDFDLWNYTTPDGRGIKKALDWLLPYSMGEKAWTYKQIGPYTKSKMAYLLLQASSHYPDKAYTEAVNQLKEEGKNSMLNIYYGK